MSSLDDATVALVVAIRAGDIRAVGHLLAEHPGLSSGPLGGPFRTRTALHVVTDWPGYFPNGPQIVGILIEAGADPNGRSPGDETPLHWTASSDDVDVAAALIDGGADIEARDGSIGTPLGNAVGYACWHVARHLVDRGARLDQPWHASALGLLGRLEDLLGDQPAPAVVSQAFWHACSGGQRRAAEYLLSQGADLNWIPDYADGTALDAANGRGTRRENVIGWLPGPGGPLSRARMTASLRPRARSHMLRPGPFSLGQPAGGTRPSSKSARRSRVVGECRVAPGTTR